jgi:hypothetical protein
MICSGENRFLDMNIPPRFLGQILPQNLDQF